MMKLSKSFMNPVRFILNDYIHLILNVPEAFHNFFNDEHYESFIQIWLK